MSQPLRFAISGLGRRSSTTYLPVFASRTPRTHLELVAMVDVDPIRLEAIKARWPKPIASYIAADFERMLIETSPDCVIVAAPDHVHCAQILSALDRHISVISEKPLCVDSYQAGQILGALHDSSCTVKVAHNLRYLNLSRAIKALLDQDHIGRVTKARFSHHLVPCHGGSYFRRWHRNREASGGLAVTKSCHHFDLLNWWLNDSPVTVSGWTARRHFLPGMAIPGEPPMNVPLDADIEDTIAAVINYRRGATVSYTLATCSTWEGFDLVLHGTKGSLISKYSMLSSENHTITVRMDNGEIISLSIPRENGRHSGADRHMIDAIFGLSSNGPTQSMTLPEAREAAVAVAIGDAVHRSAQLKQPVMIRL